MRTALLTASVLLIPALLGPRTAAAAVHAPESLTAASSTVQLDPKEKAFRDAFTQAMKIGAKAEMKQLLDKENHFAVNWIIQTAEAISASPNDVLYDRMEALRIAWKASKGTNFCEKMERYFSLLDPTIKRERVRIRRSYDKALAAYWANSEKKDPGTYTKLGHELEALAAAFAQIDDWYYSSQAWSLVGHCNDEALRGAKDADLKAACRAFKNCIEAREKIGLKDRLYLETKPRVDQLVALGYGEGGETGGEGGEPGAGTPAAAPSTLGSSISSAMTFELLEDLYALRRPSYYLDELYPTWNAIYLAEKGTGQPFPRIKDGPTVMRLGAAKVHIDVDKDGDGEGKADVAIPMRGRFEPVIFEIGEGDSLRKVAVLAMTGVAKDTYQKVEVNLEPVDESLNIYIAAAGSMVGEIDGTTIRVIDDDMDGTYGSVPMAWGHVGMTKDHYQPEMDSMVIGKSKRAVPFSEYTKVGEQWYQLEVMNGGTSLTAHPTNLKTGFLELKSKGLKPDFLIVKGTNQLENSYFDLASSKKVELPVGRYSLYFGKVSKGKKVQLMKAVIVSGSGTRTWDVLPGKTDVVEIGAPFGFAFKTTVEDRTVLVQGQSVCVVGKAGERYERIWNAVPRPQVSLRRSGSKRGTKGQTMPAVLDQDPIYEIGWAVAWFPRDVELPNKYGSEAEVQLTEKKNKLFGKIESVWK
jgi:hypothetical protein